MKPGIETNESGSTHRTVIVNCVRQKVLGSLSCPIFFSDTATLPHSIGILPCFCLHDQYLKSDLWRTVNGQMESAVTGSVSCIVVMFDTIFFLHNLRLL